MLYMAATASKLLSGCRSWHGGATTHSLAVLPLPSVTHRSSMTHDGPAAVALLRTSQSTALRVNDTQSMWCGQLWPAVKKRSKGHWVPTCKHSSPFGFLNFHEMQTCPCVAWHQKMFNPMPLHHMLRLPMFAWKLNIQKFDTMYITQLRVKKPTVRVSSGLSEYLEVFGHKSSQPQKRH